jgi:glutathione S-transferase
MRFHVLVLGSQTDFFADAPEKIPYAINRYQTETKRLYQVLNDRLASERKINNIPEGEAAYLVGNKYTLSDICVFSWGKSRPSPSLLACHTTMLPVGTRKTKCFFFLACGD